MNQEAGVVETFLFMTHGNIVKVVLNYTMGICTVYSAQDEILLRLKKVSPARMKKIKMQIIVYLVKKKAGPYSFKGFGLK